MMEFLISPLHAFGHFLFLFFRLQKLTRIPYRHRPRETVYIFDPIEYSFDGHTQRRLVDHTQDEMTLQYLSEGFEGLIESVLFRVGVRPWHMYPIGVLFGLGFDTATEIALLGISAAAAAKGLSVVAMAVFPVLFTAGMTLVDTTDGILMVGAYGWAFMKPIRKLYYNLTITFVSVIVALLVGG